MTDNHAYLSFTVSCQLGTPTRSLLTTSIQCSRVPPGLLLSPCGLHLRGCFWVQWSGICCTWPSHCSCLCFSMSTSPTSFKTSTFLCLSHSVSPRMSCRHRSWNILSLLISACGTGQVCALYREIDITSVRKARIFIAFPSFWLLKLSSSTFGILFPLSRARPSLPSLPWHSAPPHCQGKRKTLLLSACSCSVMDSWFVVHWFVICSSTARILVLLTLICTPHQAQALSTASSMCYSSLLVSATRVRSLAYSTFLMHVEAVVMLQYERKRFSRGVFNV